MTPPPWQLLALAAMVALALRTQASLLPPFRLDGFAPQTLALSTGRISASAHDAALLSDGSLVLVGATTYPPGVLAQAPIADEPDVALLEDFETSRTSCLVLRVSAVGELMWARRTALAPVSARFALAVDDRDQIYVAGETTGHNASRTPGSLLVSYDKDGVQTAITTHGIADSKYVAIHWHASRPDTLILICTAPSSSPAFTRSAYPPSQSGVCVARVERASLSRKTLTPISLGSSSVNASLVRDMFWSSTLSPSGEILYLAVRRKTRNVMYLHSFAPTLLALHTNTFIPSTIPRTLPADLQNEMTLRTSPISTGLYAGYVSRINNKERLIVHHLSANLSSAPWPGTSSAFLSHHIVQDEIFTRTTRADVHDMAVDMDGNIRLLLYASEILDRSDESSDEFELLRSLNNGRPAVVVVTSRQKISHIIQSQTSQNWVPRRLVIGSGEYFVVGESHGEKGSDLEKNPTVLLTGIERRVVPSPSPSPFAAGPPSNGGNRDDDDDVEKEACIGLSSTIDGVRVHDHVVRDIRLRLQHHPLLWRKRPLRMLCHTWRTDVQPESVICATPYHILRWHGHAIYMKDFCERMRCVRRRDLPFNFKGACRQDVRANEQLALTMHSAGNGLREADAVVVAECALRDKFRVRWLLATL